MSSKLREALSDACYAMFNFLKTQNGGYRLGADAVRGGEQMKDYSNIGAVCFDCAKKAGFTPKYKLIASWIGECGICHEYKRCTSPCNWNLSKKSEAEE